MEQSGPVLEGAGIAGVPVVRATAVEGGTAGEAAASGTALGELASERTTAGAAAEEAAVSGVAAGEVVGVGAVIAGVAPAAAATAEGAGKATSRAAAGEAGANGAAIAGVAPIGGMSAGGPAWDLPGSRYTRQLKLLGEEGQHALRKACVFVAGVGGLGGTAALYLAAAGIGKLVLAHEGVIAAPDLNRQILMDTERLGEERIETAVLRLRKLNPEVEIEGYNSRIDDTARPWVEAADVVIDARYDFPERYALNRLCVEAGKPMIEAAMYGFEISLTTILPGVTPCLECIYPDREADWEPLGFPVLGATSGIAGCLAALEAVKWITRVGTAYAGIMHRFSTIDFACYSVHLTRNPNCACCGEGG